jgi:hypothetical protein
MAQPSSASVHAVDVPLTNISTAYIQDQTSYIAGRMCPEVPVLKQTDRYYTYTKNDWFRDEAQVRKDATESAGSGYGLSTAQYSCDVFAMHKDIGYQARNNADAGINLDRDATEFVTQRLLLRREVQFVSDLFTTGVWANDVTPSNLWSDYTSSDPVEDVETGKEAILSVTGRKANKLLLGYQVYRKLRNHPDILDRIKYVTQATTRQVTPMLLAQVFDVDEVMVAEAIKATNIEGETAAYSFIFGKNALLAHVAPSPGLLVPSAMYTFSWNGVAGGIPGATIGISRFYLPKTKADRVEGESAYDLKCVGSDLGYFLSGAVA